MATQKETTTPPNSHVRPGEEVDILPLLLKLWERKFFILFSTISFSVIGFIHATFLTPIFLSNTMIQVEEKSRTLPGMTEITDTLGGDSSSQTEIELIKSRRIIGAAVDKLKLDLYAAPIYFPIIGEKVASKFPTTESGLAKPFLGIDGYAWGGEQIEIHEFQVPPRQYNNTFKIIANGDNSYTLTSTEDKFILKGVTGEKITENGYSIFISTLKARDDTSFIVRRKARLGAILGLQGRLSVFEKGSRTGIIVLSLADSDPSRAENTLNVIAKTYVHQNIERQSAQAANSLEFLRDQIPLLKTDLVKAEKKLNEYQVDVGSVDITAEASSILNQVVSIESSIAELQLEKFELDRLYTEDHPAYQAWKRQLKEQVSRRTEFNERIKSLPLTQQKLLGLKRSVEVGTEIYTRMLNNIQELDIVRAGTVGNVRIIDEAVTNMAPIKPKKSLIIMISGILGAFLAVTLIFFRAALNKGVENPDDIEAIGLPVYASIPLSDEQRKLDAGSRRSAKNLSKMKNQHPTALLAHRNPTDITIEALRSLRTSLHFAMLEASNNIMMISGPSPNVGKSFVSGNLAAVVAQAGQRVLLIDMDLRKGYMHKMFDMGPEDGVSDVLAKRVDLQKVIRPTKINELFILPRGAIPPNPSELLMSKGLTELFKTVSGQYDLIIVDTPPIMAVTDAAIVGRQCGVTMIVARFGLNPIKELEVTKQRFEQNGITVKGVVLNAVERRASGYGYGYGYGYYQYEYKSDKS
ncbi:polysaccharide biosynthesis tyrosine autokinase [Zhongshania sp.]|jgi:tyrosine-protein kinase Etk/Wzc|uniref:polysaccharide biosynthesis tyrosine autokinase n=1 Tax=Zhongshania sp. TaxID=1971902 RepID=UPI0039E4C64F